MTGAYPARILAILTPIPPDKVLPRYGIAVAAGVLAIVLRWTLDPILGHVAFFVTVYITVTFCALVCGALPAMLSGSVGFPGILYWFVDPRHSLQLIRQPRQVHNIIGAFIVCAALILLGAAYRSKQLRLNNTVKALTNEARERQRAL